MSTGNHETKPDITIEERLQEMRTLFGPPPVLSWENPKAYDRVLRGFLESYPSGNYMQKLLIRQMADEQWEVIRLTRHKTMAIEQSLQPLSVSQSRSLEAAQSGKQCREDALAEADPNEVRTDEIRKVELGIERWAWSENTLDACDRAVEDKGQVCALKDAALHYQWLDDRKSVALDRRDEAFELYELYARIVPPIKSGMDEVIEGEFEIVPAPALAPALSTPDSSSQSESLAPNGTRPQEQKQ